MKHSNYDVAVSSAKTYVKPSKKRKPSKQYVRSTARGLKVISN